MDIRAIFRIHGHKGFYHDLTRVLMSQDAGSLCTVSSSSSAAVSKPEVHSLRGDDRANIMCSI